MNQSESPPSIAPNIQGQGLYILWLEVYDMKIISIGSLGLIQFPKGFYAYVGSAQRHRHSRIARHLKSGKKLHWHIDYLREQATIFDVTLLDGNKEDECALANYMANFGGSFIIPRFGSSDCKCQSHLLYFPPISEFPKTIIEIITNFHPHNIEVVLAQ